MLLDKFACTNIKKYLSNSFINLLAIITVGSQLTGCNQAVAYSTDSLKQSKVEIPKAVISHVSKTFQANFVYGDWRFQGTEITNHAINAYIQIPSKLNLSEEQQKAYINQMICPKPQQTEFWQVIDNYPLWVHIYTQYKNKSVYVQCQKPQANLSKV